MTDQASVESPASFEQWRTEIGPVLEALHAVLNSAQRTVSQRREAVLDASDQLRAVSQHVMGWLPKHPCPFADVNWLVVSTTRSCAALGRLFEQEAHHPNGINRWTLNRETKETARALSKTTAMIRDQA
jgi:hypothetical protein